MNAPAADLFRSSRLKGGGGWIGGPRLGTTGGGGRCEGGSTLLSVLESPETCIIG